MKKRSLVLTFCILVIALLVSCSVVQDNSTDMATSIASTFIAGQTQSVTASQAEPQSTSTAENSSAPSATSADSYPIGKCMVQNVPAGVVTPFSFEWKECVIAVELQTDGSMKVIFEWEVTKTGPGSMPDEQCFTKGSDYQNPNMYMVDDLGNHYASTDVGMDIGICMLIGDMESNSFTDYFMFPPAHPGAKFLVFHDDDQGLQTEPFNITWPH